MSAPLELSTDVLVIGGGPAAAWAALHARGSGAGVILVDKGYCGTSGATAPSGTGVWYVAPTPTAAAPPRRAARHSAVTWPTIPGWTASSIRPT
jgi:succinate dehydrogenase/fumarate reductase flavoprotein subunit